MKTIFYRYVSVWLPCIVVIQLIGCTGARQSADEEEYFSPVPRARVTHPSISARRSDSSGIRIIPPGTVRKSPITVDPAVAAMIRENNERLGKLEQDVRSISMQKEMEAYDAGKKAGAVQGADNTTSETLLAMLREQNLRLNELMEQIRALSEQRMARQEPVVSPSRQSRATQRPAAGPSAYYSQGLKQYRSGKFADAVRTLRMALSKGLQASQADNCRFWIGVSLFNQKQAAAALVEFRAVIADRRSDKRSSALFMTAQLLEQQGQRDLAQQHYRQIVKEYPASNLGILAQRKIAMSGRPGIL